MTMSGSDTAKAPRSKAQAPRTNDASERLVDRELADLPPALREWKGVTNYVWRSYVFSHLKTKP
ncbi:protein of unknown function [Shinella sp. WSC3-e]|nr:hypothetical protein SHINE37_41096 [Rhizobiaceae bacterium]CAK7255745.1 protein of unknown function [Shinella sp. WSC3-e]